MKMTLALTLALLNTTMISEVFIDCFKIGVDVFAAMEA